jgi:hypothetical protein
MPPLSGCTAAVSSRPCSGPTTAPHRAALRPLLLHIRVGARDEIVSVSRLKPCMDTDSKPGSLRCRSQPPGTDMVFKPTTAHCGSPPTPRRVSSHTPSLCTIMAGAAERMPRNHFYQPLGGFLHALGRLLHSSGTCSASEDRQQGLTSDLTFSVVSGRGGGGGVGPVESLAMPLDPTGSSRMVCFTTRCTLCYLYTECLFLSLFQASTLKIRFCRIFKDLTLSVLLFLCKLSVKAVCDCGHIPVHVRLCPFPCPFVFLPLSSVSLFLFVCVPVCLCPCSCLSVSLFLSVCVPVPVCLCPCPCHCPSVSLFLSLSVCVPVPVCLCPFSCPCPCPCLSLFLSLSAFVSVPVRFVPVPVVCVPVPLSVRLCPLPLPVRLCLCPSACPSVSLSLSICVPVPFCLCPCPLVSLSLSICVPDPIRLCPCP